ncbi:sensor histidine kinase [Corynebacterium endometrii]|uniref:Sensor-like histidine kinase SenX3 n=1 Tax=Corynebacterium endometrii TaxID=2488819 RepID=A0A4P7QDJ2_9CORY|nr:ATP-binding protein [Corynebacterium endometrii]QCB27605.1 Signal-transduction histidine kinase senX3 [Corynebacterium endometrii]
MQLALAFIAGVLVCALAAPLIRWIRRRLERRRLAAATAANQVTTLSQVFNLAIQGSPVGVTVVDNEGSVVVSNTSSHEMSIVHDRTLNPDIWTVSQEVFEDKETRTVDLSIPRRRTGNRVSQVKAVVQPLTLHDDRFVIVYATDESESVRMESARRDFVANVSHELKTPVGGIALLSEALLQDPGDAEHVQYFGAKIQKEASRMGNMVSELIALSKLQGAEALPEMEPCPVDEIVDEAIHRNQLGADARNIAITRGARAEVDVLCDKSLIVTAVSNLISNAVNYSPDGVQVSISHKVVSEDVVYIRVTDRGIGIAPEDQKRVFERFFRVDKARSRSTGGTGLGLAIVKHVVANHGGNIKLWSRPGTGSTFTIELPIYHNQNPAELPDSRNNDSTKSIKARGTSLPGSLPSAMARVAARRKEKEK